MAWLRIDDGFDTHPKVVALGTPDRRWTWMRILIYTCRHRTEIIPTGIKDVVPKANRKYLEECRDLGLIDMDSGGVMRVHDWADYQAGDPKKAARQRRWRNAYVDDPVDGDVDASRVGAPARPVPSRPVITTTDGPTAAAVERLQDAGWSDGQVNAAVLELGRAVAWLDHAEADPSCRSVGALSWSMFNKGGSPDTAATVANGAQGTRSTSKPVTYTCVVCDEVFDTYRAREDHVYSAHFEPSAPPVRSLTA